MIEIIGNPTIELKKKMEEYNIEYRIKTNISKEKVCEKHMECDVLYFASLSEGFELPIIEAQAIGNPVITGSTLPTKEVAGDVAILVDPHSYSDIRTAIKTLIQDNVFREKLIQRGFINVRKYAPAVVAKKYFHFYQSYFQI